MNLAATLSAPQVLNLPADLGIEHAETLKQMLTQCANETGTITLDGEQVHRLHGAAMQLLLAFVRARQTAGLSWGWQQASPALMQAAEHLGLTASLRLNRQAATPLESH